MFWALLAGVPDDSQNNCARAKIGYGGLHKLQKQSAIAETMRIIIMLRLGKFQ